MKKEIHTLRLQLFPFLIFLVLISASSPAQWTRKTDGLKTRSEVTSVVFDSRLYTFLGFSNWELKPETTSEVYDPAANTWKLLASIPAKASMTHQGVVLIDNTVWHIGGRVGQNPGPLTADIWIYNITANSWYKGPQLKNPATGNPLSWAAGGAVLLGRTLHIVGGFINTACNNDQSTYHLTLDVDTWLADTTKPAKWMNNLAPLPVKRNHFSTVTLGGKIYVIGGQLGHDCDGGLDKQYAHVYDPPADTWTQLPLLPAPRSHTEGGAFAIDGKIFIVAGQGNSGTSTNKVTIFDPAGNNGAGSWKDEASLALPKSYEGVSAKVIKNIFIYSHGGEGSSQNTRKSTYSRNIVRNPVYKLGFSSGCLNLAADPGTIVTGKTLLFTIDSIKNYTTSSNASWLTVTKNAVGIATQNAVDIEVTANTAGLAPGTYNGTITATGSATAPAYSKATYCVNLVVLNKTPSSQTYEAEKAVLKGVIVASGNSGYTGTGYADYQNSSGDYVQWTVSKSVTGVAFLHFRYANGSTSNRSLKLEVNGVTVSSNLSFPPTGAWTKWDSVSVSTTLNGGTNTVRLTAIGYNGPNIDYLSYSPNIDDLSFSAGSSEAVQRQAMNNRNLSVPSDVLIAHVLPNPASGSANLVLNTSSQLAVEVEIIDMAGRTCRKMKLFGSGRSSFNFSVRDLADGIYIIKARQGKKTATVKLIVNRK